MNIQQAKETVNGWLFSGHLSLNDGEHVVQINDYKFKINSKMGLVQNIEVLA